MCDVRNPSIILTKYFWFYCIEIFIKKTREFMNFMFIYSCSAVYLCVAGGNNIVLTSLTIQLNRYLLYSFIQYKLNMWFLVNLCKLLFHLVSSHVYFPFIILFAYILYK